MMGRYERRLIRDFWDVWGIHVGHQRLVQLQGFMSAYL